MDERRKRTLRLLLFLTVQVVSLAVLEHQQQSDAQQSFTGAGPSFTTQTLIPVSGMWEFMHSTAIVAYVKRRNVCRTLFGKEDESGDEVIDQVVSKRRKYDHTCEEDTLANLLMSSSRAIQNAFAEHIRGHIDSNALNSEIDRFQRREQSNKLVSVLGDLAEVMALIADKL